MSDDNASSTPAEPDWSALGTIGWFDLTVPDADVIRDFYADVVGWRTEPVDMGGYSDWNMTDKAGMPRAGVCWQRGPNSTLPAVWLAYVNVRDLDLALERALERGGEAIKGPTNMGGSGRYAVIRDPAGAVLGLFEPKQ